MSSILRTSQMSPEHNNVNQKVYHTHVKNTIFDFEQEHFFIKNHKCIAFDVYSKFNPLSVSYLAMTNLTFLWTWILSGYLGDSRTMLLCVTLYPLINSNVQKQ